MERHCASALRCQVQKEWLETARARAKTAKKEIVIVCSHTFVATRVFSMHFTIRRDGRDIAEDMAAAAYDYKSKTACVYV